MPRVSQNSNIATCFFVRERKRQTNRQVNRRTETGRERQRERERAIFYYAQHFSYLVSGWIQTAYLWVPCIIIWVIHFCNRVSVMYQISDAYLDPHKSLWYSFFVRIVDNFSTLNNFAKMLYHKHSAGSWISAFVCAK